MATDLYAQFVDNANYPSRSPTPVSPHDTNELPVIPKALYVGTGGTLVLRGVGATADVTFKNVANGQVLDVRAQFVRATGTTAADIVALV